jgi:hypothetical protein
MATTVSLWLAMFACVMGCTQPLLADSNPAKPSAINQKLIGEDAPEAMAVMENCPHSGHHNSKSDDKQTPTNSISCCPLEVTVASKPEIAKQIAIAPDFVPVPNFDLAAPRIYFSEETASIVFHTGRDTLLKTQLLRI